MNSGRAKVSVSNETEPFVRSTAIAVLNVANPLLNSRLAPGGQVANVAMFAVMTFVEAKDVGVASKRLNPNTHNLELHPWYSGVDAAGGTDTGGRG